MLDNTQADALLTELVERYSPSTQERPAVEYLVGQMNTLGFSAYIDGAGNAVGELGRGKLGNGEQTVLLLGHIDTVPGEIRVHREGNLLYGRGTVDAKGPLAAFVAAAARAGEQKGKRIVVVGAVEEEAATSKGARFLLDQVQPDAVVIGEPSGWDAVTVGYKGRLLIDYALSQSMGHTAGPETAVCETAVTFWQHIADYADTYNANYSRMFDQLRPSLRRINTHSDGFTERVEMVIGFRLPPEIDIDVLRAMLLGWAGDAQITFRGREVAFRGSRSSELARVFVRALSEEGVKAQFKVKSGTSDMNVVGPAWGCPILAYGPGDSACDHTPHEHIDLDDYHRAIQVLTHVLAHL